MGGDPCTLLLNDESFNVWILTIRHNSHEEERRDDLAGLRICDLSRISCPVNLDLFAGFPVDVHGGTTFLFVLLDVIAELRIHQRFVAGLTVLLKVFRPEKLFVDSIAEKLLLDVIEVRHPFIGACFGLLGKHKLFESSICQ